MVEYDPKHWTSHLFDIRNSMFHAIFGRVLACVGWSIAGPAGPRALQVPAGDVDHASIPPTVHSLVGVALGLLLVFRTNTAYDRFWEGRKLWGGIVNESRNLARLASVHLKDDPALLRSTVRWTVAWSHAAMHGLEGRRGVRPGRRRAARPRGRGVAGLGPRRRSTSRGGSPGSWSRPATRG